MFAPGVTSGATNHLVAPHSKLCDGNACGSMGLYSVVISVSCLTLGYTQPSSRACEGSPAEGDIVGPLRTGTGYRFAAPGNPSFLGTTVEKVLATGHDSLAND